MIKMHLACAADVHYVPHSAAMLHSVLTHRGESTVHVHFLHGGDIPDDYFRGLRHMVEANGGAISFVHVTREEVAGLPTTGHLPTSHWYRVFLPQLRPELDRILYLDGDLIALESLAPLWRTELADNYLAAVTNVFQHDHVNRPAELGLPNSRAYFNTGVQLMNLELMRRDGSTEAVIEWAQSHWDKLAWPEQDAVNVVLGERRVPLHPRWNLMNSILLFEDSVRVFGPDVVAEARRNPAIRHFEGPGVNKPWHYLCARRMRELYAAHRRQTPWPEVEIEGATLANRFRRLAGALRERKRRDRILSA